MSNSSYKLNGRIWLEVDGEKMLGHGRVELLERIQVSGSIRQAALQMKMSYKQAWDLINQMNANFENPIVISQRGGKGGGKAIVTQEGVALIAKFHQLNAAFKTFLKQHGDIFGSGDTL